ncbi:MAG: hypothetical protein IPK80_16130 [Nannocystis sp.]|nr:hypothetical protein [Nannocystis sp.]
MSASVLIRSIDEYNSVLGALQSRTPDYKRLPIDSALAVLRDLDLLPEWESGAQIRDKLVQADQGLTAAKLSRKLNGAIKRNTLTQIRRGRRGLSFQLACLWSGGLTVEFEDPELAEKLRERGLTVSESASSLPPLSPPLDPGAAPPDDHANVAPDLRAEAERNYVNAAVSSVVFCPRTGQITVTLVHESTAIGVNVVDGARSQHRSGVNADEAARLQHKFGVVADEPRCHKDPNPNEPIESDTLEKNCLPPSQPLPHAGQVQQSQPAAAPVRLTPDHDRERELEARERELAARERELAAREQEVQKQEFKVARRAKRARGVLQREASLAEKERAMATQQLALDREAAEVAAKRVEVGWEVAAKRAEIERQAEFAEMKRAAQRDALEKDVKTTTAALEKDVKTTKAALEQDVKATKAELEKDVKATKAELEQEVKATKAALEQDVKAAKATLEQEVKAAKAALEQEAKAQKTEWEKLEAEKARLAQLDAEIQEKMAKSQKLMRTVAERSRSLMEAPVTNPTLAAIVEVVKEATKK